MQLLSDLLRVDPRQVPVKRLVLPQPLQHEQTADDLLAFQLLLLQQHQVLIRTDLGFRVHLVLKRDAPILIEQRLLLLHSFDLTRLLLLPHPQTTPLRLEEEAPLDTRLGLSLIDSGPYDRVITPVKKPLAVMSRLMRLVSTCNTSLLLDLLGILTHSQRAIEGLLVRELGGGGLEGLVADKDLADVEGGLLETARRGDDDVTLGRAVGVMKSCVFFQ